MPIGKKSFVHTSIMYYIFVPGMHYNIFPPPKGRGPDKKNDKVFVCRCLRADQKIKKYASSTIIEEDFRVNTFHPKPDFLSCAPGLQAAVPEEPEMVLTVLTAIGYDIESIGEDIHWRFHNHIYRTNIDGVVA